ncbi:MAG: hypothetical protein ACT4QF_19310 [Sporichthyaceae bacterium]
MKWASWLDEYDREARLAPALLALLPIILAAIGLGVQQHRGAVAIVGICVAVGVPMVVAKQVADRGRSVESRLFLQWGAPPTTLLLVPPDDAAMGEMQRQRRARLEQISGITLPASPRLSDADVETYQAAVRSLIEHTRDRTKFPVVWSELKNYGFERNTLGLRKVGAAGSSVSTLALLGGAVSGLSGGPVSVPVTLALAMVCALIGLAWWRIPSEQRVRAAANRYAERLLDAAAVLR